MDSCWVEIFSQKSIIISDACITWSNPISIIALEFGEGKVFQSFRNIQHICVRYTIKHQQSFDQTLNIEALKSEKQILVILYVQELLQWSFGERMFFCAVIAWTDQQEHHKSTSAWRLYFPSVFQLNLSTSVKHKTHKAGLSAFSE